jgi:thiol-disulfide isomerase/thioredoxin
MTAFIDHHAKAGSLMVACLCAQWCRTCDSYRAVFDAAVSALPNADVEGMWVDVEDQADAVGAVDVENFPTLLIAQGDEVLFFGPVTPHASTLTRLLEAALGGQLSAGPGPIDASVQELPERLRRLR